MGSLIQLDASKNKGHLRIENKTPTKAEIILYGAIGSSMWEDSISAKQFSDALKQLSPDTKEIIVRINSPGGDVWDGVSIYNRLKQHPAKVICIVDGIAASIASVIALAGDQVIAGEGSLFMIHLPWTMAMGNRMDMENTIQRLMDVEEQLISIYAKKTKLSRNEIRAMMESETWMDSQSAMDQGFIDEMAEETMPIAASMLDKAKWLNKTPKNIVTETDVIKKNVTDIQSKINSFLKK